MFRVKTTRRNVKRAVSPIRPATDISGHVDLSALTQPTNEAIHIQAQAPTATPVDQSMEKQFNSFFEDESAATSLTRPWLRLERGFRLKKYRAFADAYPGLSDLEKENLIKVLVKANDAKLLNTKTQIQYEGGVILSIKGLKIIKTGDPTEPAVFKIDVTRATKKNTE